MRRLIPLAALLVVGCGQSPQPSGQPPVSPTLEVKATPTTAKPTVPSAQPTEPKGEAVGKKTYTRKQIKDFLFQPKTLEQVKKEYGLPDSTREVRTTDPDYRNSLVVTFTVYTYKGLSVDADGSGKVDSETHLYFYTTGTCHARMTEFVP